MDMLPLRATKTLQHHHLQHQAAPARQAKPRELGKVAEQGAAEKVLPMYGQQSQESQRYLADQLQSEREGTR
jgi:hypothetical protein